MIRSFKGILLLLIIINLNQILYAQFYFLEDVNEQIEIEFLKKKIETDVDKTFFNVVKVSNPTNRTINCLVNFSYPAEWSFIGEKTQRLSLGANDSILLPFRGSPSINAKGDIGYAIVASLSDLNGNTFKNEYSFINIPKKQSILFKPINKVEYIDKNKKSADVQIMFANNGNTDEVFYIEIEFDQTISTLGSEDQLYIDEILLKPYTDTLYNLTVYYNEDLDYYKKSFHAVRVKATTVDTTLVSGIWLKILESNFHNVIPQKYSMLNVELSFSNLFKNDNSTTRSNIYGTVAFKDQSFLKYKFRNYNSNFSNDPWKYGRYELEYNRPNWAVKLGDIGSSMEQSMYGRGAELSLDIGNNKLEVLGTKAVTSDRVNFGAKYSRKFAQNNLYFGGSYVNDNNINQESALGFIGFIKSTQIGGRFRINGGYSLSDYGLNTGEIKQVSGLGGSLNYYHKIFGGNLSFNTKYGDKGYEGRNQGKFEMSGNYSFPIKSNANSIIATYRYSNTKPPVVKNGSFPRESYTFSEFSKLTYNIRTSHSTQVSIGPLISRLGANNFYGFSDLFEFHDLGYYLYAALRYYGNNNSSVNLTIQGGGNTVTRYSEEGFNSLENDLQTNWMSGIVSLSYRHRIWGLYAKYYHGPFTMTQHFSNFYNNYYSKNIRIYPYIDLYLFKDFLQILTKVNYSYDITAFVGRLNVMNELNVRPNDNWLFSFLTTYNYQSSLDQITTEKFTYSNTYFEFRVNKKFNFKQPSYQYHDLEIHFFKDLNGNQVKDEDEPGVQNVLCNISNDEDKSEMMDYNTSVFFLGVDLLSDVNGKIQYQNIPNGFYKIEYFPVGEKDGAFTSEQTYEYIFIGDKTKLYVPFFENNKIFGKVILNRSKLSNLGMIDPSNIKVTAEDTYGKKYSSLTDQNGNFLIYVPNVDKYKVRVNNIFYENFELEQNDYEVQLNGYRQFEVNFVFNEKKRKINFTSSYEYGSTSDGPGIEIVRRTNINGTVKDATTLKPIVADIRIVDKQGNQITTAKSSLKTGIYTTSFVAGDDYSVEIMAPDYWYHAENLYSNQIVTFKNLKKDVLLKAITVGSIIPMQTLNFEAGSYEIPATSFPELVRLMTVLKKNPTVKIAVHGHADDLEILDSEADLALERAKLVARYLIANGYNRVKYVGHANTKPIADNDTEDGRKLNRRVEIVVTGK